MGGPATFIELWWTEGNTTTLLCGPQDGGNGIMRSITPTKPKGLTNRLVGAVAGGLDTNVSPPPPTAWDPPVPAH